ncbi:Splicing factor 3B subunit 5 [Perkinsus chesapeaki]|uniref:Splicing factor 3B subunit 5 n=1 Tax=Perkinsus chesapeaki TaxID=330153 RepID=A0A7J6MN11_PERCH|nr:Splicing factor 3B subunit 5 [Perkinsus chesapeaki]
MSQVYEGFNIHAQLDHLHMRYPGTGHADMGRYEWATIIHRDTMASHVGHQSRLAYIAICENEPIARVRYNCLMSEAEIVTWNRTGLHSRVHPGRIWTPTNSQSKWRHGDDKEEKEEEANTITLQELYVRECLNNAESRKQRLTKALRVAGVCDDLRSRDATGMPWEPFEEDMIGNRTPAEWMSLCMGADGIYKPLKGIALLHDSWEECLIYGYDPDLRKFSVKPLRSHSAVDELLLPAFDLTIDGETPEEFAERRKSLRRRHIQAETLQLYHMLINNMPTFETHPHFWKASTAVSGDMPRQLLQNIIKRVDVAGSTRMASGLQSRSAKDTWAVLEGILYEARLSFARAHNSILLDDQLACLKRKTTLMRYDGGSSLPRYIRGVLVALSSLSKSSLSPWTSPRDRPFLSSSASFQYFIEKLSHSAPRAWTGVSELLSKVAALNYEVEGSLAVFSYPSVSENCGQPPGVQEYRRRAVKHAGDATIRIHQRLPQAIQRVLLNAVDSEEKGKLSLTAGNVNRAVRLRKVLKLVRFITEATLERCLLRTVGDFVETVTIHRPSPLFTVNLAMVDDGRCPRVGLAEGVALGAAKAIMDTFDESLSVFHEIMGPERLIMLGLEAAELASCSGRLRDFSDDNRIDVVSRNWGKIGEWRGTVEEVVNETVKKLEEHCQSMAWLDSLWVSDPLDTPVLPKQLTEPNCHTRRLADLVPESIAVAVEYDSTASSALEFFDCDALNELLSISPKKVARGFDSWTVVTRGLRDLIMATEPTNLGLISVNSEEVFEALLSHWSHLRNILARKVIGRVSTFVHSFEHSCSMLQKALLCVSATEEELLARESIIRGMPQAFDYLQNARAVLVSYFDILDAASVKLPFDDLLSRVWVTQVYPGTLKTAWRRAETELCPRDRRQLLMALKRDRALLLENLYDTKKIFTEAFFDDESVLLREDLGSIILADWVVEKADLCGELRRRIQQMEKKVEDVTRRHSLLLATEIEREEFAGILQLASEFGCYETVWMLLLDWTKYKSTWEGRGLGVYCNKEEVKRVVIEGPGKIRCALERISGYTSDLGVLLIANLEAWKGEAELVIALLSDDLVGRHWREISCYFCGAPEGGLDPEVWIHPIKNGSIFDLASLRKFASVEHLQTEVSKIASRARMEAESLRKVGDFMAQQCHWTLSLNEHISEAGYRTFETRELHVVREGAMAAKEGLAKLIEDAEAQLPVVAETLWSAQGQLDRVLMMVDRLELLHRVWEEYVVPRCGEIELDIREDEEDCDELVEIVKRINQCAVY